MAKYGIGDYIREVRERKGYTQEELSHGICSASSLSRIESGLQKPGYHTLDVLLERLGTGNGAFTVFVSKEEALFYELKRQIRLAIMERDYKTMKTLLDMFEEKIDSRVAFQKQYYFYVRGILFLEEKESYEKVMEYYKKAIHVTLPEFNGNDPLERMLLTFDEITIIEAIASIHAKEGNVQTAIKLGNWLKEYMETRVVDTNEQKKKYPMILFNLTNWLAKRKRYLDVLEVAENGIKFCIDNGTLRCFPELVFNKACALAELGKKEEAKHFFTQAAVLFESVGEMQKREQAVVWCKENYQIDIKMDVLSA